LSAGRRPRRLLLLHHSHTDVGYTAPAGQVAAWQAAWIRRALDLVEQTRGATRPFRWVCETAWGVERFLAVAGPGERARLAEAVRRREIGLSANWLNLSELADGGLLQALAARGAALGPALGLPGPRCAMAADINGFGWGFAAALAAAGVVNLFACVHSHHGAGILGRRQTAFRWEDPQGRELLVWLGEHYHFGNELGLAPGACASYLVKDELDAAAIHGDPWRVATTRIPRYLDALAAAGHPLDTAPLMVSGLRTDNSPPGETILSFLERWRREGDPALCIELGVLEDWFDELRGARIDWPRHRGDWPDWWSDGPSSQPEGLRLYRRALRQRDRALALHGLADREGCPPEAPQPALEGGARLTGAVAGHELDGLLGLYAEHTFSHHASVHAPWFREVARIGAGKRALAAQALAAASARRLGAEARLGAAEPAPGRPLLWRLVNPWAEPVAGAPALVVQHWEFNELGLDAGARALDAGTGEELPLQLEMDPDGARFRVWVELAPGESRRVRLEPRPRPPAAMLSPLDPRCADGVADLLAPGAPEPPARTGRLALPGLELAWDGQGLRRWLDPVSGRDWLADAPWPGLALLHEHTPCQLPGEAGSVRGAMGRNRRSGATRRSLATWKRLLADEDGPLWRRLEWELEGPGLAYARLELRLWKPLPAAESALRLQLPGRWEPESLYLALPFAGGACWLDKAGAVIQAGVDLLPGALLDYSCLQAGFALDAGDEGFACAFLDQPLLWTGPLDAAPRRLQERPAPLEHPRFAWLANTLWETNFEAQLGGFHEFRHRFAWGRELAGASAALAACRALHRGPIALRLGHGDGA
jgi:hypothetical protein